MTKPAVRRRVTVVEAGRSRVREDRLTGEEPLEIRVDGRALAVTMRTPGHDVELALGYLVSEGVITRREQIRTARYCAGATDEGVNTYNVLDVQVDASAHLDHLALERHGYTSSSCGVCGKTSIDAVTTKSAFEVGPDPLTVPAELLTALPDRMRDVQSVFDQTGGLHAAGLFDGRTGEPLVVREDVGRHNAVDKVVGWALEHEKLPLAGCVLLVSGRAGFELVQKASMAGAPLLAAISAPSSLAVELGEEAGLTVVGFLRGSSMVVYSRPDRVEA
ncbi:formate dehydrogenase accessory sulfurtransferase FdhD [Aeromicrobium tamlense]|uniref:Sulfur carrier protein FdhD n=1 Tax=Aeromicrobium tamlense TaxID=375541 RepID=A0A8I0G225_9ACTN|nr:MULTISPECIES: formate dehydrogenase accessory sulfurtransferase FdhD [Aeromicrobium]MBD1272112.1 formate dehydrogenase accessory sulfurtransferase FdhD [Aeromicrobium tamlense]NYI38694.1 FdhD protein [Aeromicrobium tamlense]